MRHPIFLESMLKAIIGIEIDVHALVGKWKLSQNRDVADRAGVVAGLAQHPRTAGNDLASWILLKECRADAAPADRDAPPPVA